MFPIYEAFVTGQEIGQDTETVGEGKEYVAIIVLYYILCHQLKSSTLEEIWLQFFTCSYTGLKLALDFFSLLDYSLFSMNRVTIIRLKIC